MTNEGDSYESMGREDSYAGTWEGAGFGEDDHAVGAGDVAFDEVLGGRSVCLLLNWWCDGGDGCWGGGSLSEWLT